MTKTSTERLPNLEAIRHFDNKALKASFDYREVAAVEHAIAFTVAKMMDGDMLSDVHHFLSESLKNGTDFNDFKKQLKPYLMEKGWWGEQIMGDPYTGELKKVRLGSTRRLRTIFHTNMHSAYAAGQWQRIQDTKKALPYLQYMPSLSEHKRDGHKRYYGIVRPVDDPIWQQIYPPNGYGCRCWVKQLTRSQALAAGISPPQELEMQEVVNKRTGEVLKVPKAITPSFAHNHDRLTAMQKIYDEKLAGWSHIPETQKKARKKAFERSLNEYMLDLVNHKDFNSMVPTVVGQDFARRFKELSIWVNEKIDNKFNELQKNSKKKINRNGVGRKISEQLMNEYKNKGESEYWVAATLGIKERKLLDVNTQIIRLSAESVIKMIAHHQHDIKDMMGLFKNTAYLLKNTVDIVQQKDVKIIYFIADKSHYQAVVKRTADKNELYLLTIFEMEESDFKEKLKESAG